ncbi:hypothetical protein KR018_000055 [Drosophila ironensis]|nr:hypothetical protein KR018_000055 [Drosophila ironensis]
MASGENASTDSGPTKGPMTPQRNELTLIDDQNLRDIDNRLEALLARVDALENSLSELHLSFEADDARREADNLDYFESSEGENAATDDTVKDSQDMEEELQIDVETVNEDDGCAETSFDAESEDHGNEE